MNGNNVRLRLTLMNEEQMQQVHHYALQILTTTGVRVDSPAVLRLLQDKIGAVQVEAGNARIPAEIVEWALKSAPSGIDVFNRRGEPAFQAGDGRMRFGIGVTALYYMDAMTDRLERFGRSHMQAMARLGGRLPHYDVIATVGIVQDVPAPLSDLYASLEMIANTTKPLVLLVSDEDKFPLVLDMYAHLHGELGARPFIIPYFNPVTPLVMNAGTADKMHTAIRRGLPVIFSSYSMAGMSAPLTPVGTLALLMAELLAGLVISQVIKEGAPVLLGMLPNYFDMKSMVSFYDPQSILLNLACAEMLAYYNIPHCGSSGSGTGWGADLIAADTYWMNTLTYALVRGGLAPFVGDTLGAKVFSPNTVVYVHEVIDQARRLANGFQLDDVNAVLGEIAEAGSGGSFLSSPSTLRNYRTGYYPSPVFPRWSMEKWQAEGAPQAQTILRKYTQQLIETAPAPEDHDELIAKGEEYIKSL
jgi:trimethylamine--corrinoid protein Co-methyltransferase